MEIKYNRRHYNAGMKTFFLSGLCTIASGIIVSILRDLYQFNYSFSGTLISMMNIGNMSALILSGMLPQMIGERSVTLIFSSGYFVGYLLMALTGNPVLLILAFMCVGMAKGCTANKSAILVGSNAPDRSKALSLMNAWFSLGAVLCPFVISVLQKRDDRLAMAGLSMAGLALWFVFLRAGIPEQFDSAGNKKSVGAASFMRNSAFWLLAALVFCQNAAEYVVNGWIVTYYKGENILSGTAAVYTVTIQWIFILVSRLLLAFGPEIKKPYKVISVMGAGLTMMYLLLLKMQTAVPALISLCLFSFCIAGVYPLATACVGEMTSSASLGVLLSIGATGGILFPWIVGLVADRSGLRAGMAVNLIPCVGIIILPMIISRSRKRNNL